MYIWLCQHFPIGADDHGHVLLQRRAGHAERLAELGTLTGGLAHEIKNPLSTVQLNLQLLEEDLDPRDANSAEPATLPSSPDVHFGRSGDTMVSNSRMDDDRPDLREPEPNATGRVPTKRPTSSPE